MVFPFMGTLFTAVLSAALALVMPSAAAYAPVATVFFCAWLGCVGVGLLLPRPHEQEPPSQADYEEHGLGPLMTDAPPAQLYLDLMKRVILNLCYHEQSHQVVLARSVDEGRATPELASRFSMRARVLGEDVSLNTLSMIGLRRLDSLQACISALVAEGIRGDLLEAGCAKGGACIFMRAALRAHRDTERTVFCCDTFADQPPPPSPLRVALVRPLYLGMGWLTARLPLAAHRWLYGRLMRLQRSFPVDEEHVSDDTVSSFIFFLTHTHYLRPQAGARLGSSLAHVKSHFARLGLLDDQVLGAGRGGGGGDRLDVSTVIISLWGERRWSSQGRQPFE